MEHHDNAVELHDAERLELAAENSFISQGTFVLKGGKFLSDIS